MIEIIKEQLYFSCRNTLPKSNGTISYFSIDDTLVYRNYFLDFGPLKLSYVYAYCQDLHQRLIQASQPGWKVIHCTEKAPEKRANSAFLIGAYQVLLLHKTPQEAYETLAGKKKSKYLGFRDASNKEAVHHLSLLDCFRGLWKAMHSKIFSFDKFDLDEYEFLDMVENGDINWIVPKKLLAFCSPREKETVDKTGHPLHSPEFYFPYFHKMGVKTVIRLNSKLYDRHRFADAGIQHFDLLFADGTVPTSRIVHRFFRICEKAPGAVAVHCKAGLGRTGTLIACYLMKYLGFTACEAIAWVRICRPGSIIGPQAHWLEKRQAWISRRKLKEAKEFTSFTTSYSKLKGIVKHKVEDKLKMKAPNHRRKSDRESMRRSCNMKKENAHYPRALSRTRGVCRMRLHLFKGRLRSSRSFVPTAATGCR